VTRARLLFWSADRAAEALDVVQRAAERMAAPARARVLAYGAYVAAFACDPGTAVGWATAAIADAGEVASFRLEALATASLALMLQGRTAEAVCAAEEALPLVPSEMPNDHSLVAVIPAAYAMARVLEGRLAEAAAIAAAAEAVATDGQVTIVRGLAGTLAGRIALCEGRLDAAWRSGRQGLDALGDAGLASHWPAAVLATAAAQLGDLATAREVLDQAADGVPPVPLYRLELALAQAWFAAAQGEVSTARARAQQAADDARAAAVWTFELFALLDLARLGAPDRAAARLGELTQVVDGTFAAAAAAYARALAARDGAGLEQASVRWEAIGALLLAAEAAASAADVHRAAGLRGGQLTCTARARDLLAACGGARTPAVRDLDADLLLRSLTGREREVVGLAALGLTNRDIATRLYVSVRAVTTHLCHVYAKLGISDREQLPAVLIVAGEHPGPVAT
jgi:ATP/maltotriose-dependent transcriptional regulator MalT